MPEHPRFGGVAGWEEDGGSQMAGLEERFVAPCLDLPRRWEEEGGLVKRRVVKGVLTKKKEVGGVLAKKWEVKGVLTKRKVAGDVLPGKKVEGVVEYFVGECSWWEEGFDWLFLPKLWLRPLRPFQSLRDLSVGF